MPDVEVFDPTTLDPATISERSRLRQSMISGGIKDDEQAHHIVPGGNPQNGGTRDATPAQDKLKALGLDLNSGADNGVALSPEFHGKVHTIEYYDYINKSLAEATNAGQARDVLNQIRTKLQQADAIFKKTGAMPTWK